MFALLRNVPAITTDLAVEEFLLFTPPAHLAVIAVENIIDLSAPILVQFALETGVLTESNLALRVNAFN